ncbi:S8 family serine peptidase [Nocardioides sp.]|uniref:S8 family serine peptidase n=1 Tax=Nocardioides sp. TaxID=35761 RepID=UPI003D0A74D2
MMSKRRPLLARVLALVLIVVALALGAVSPSAGGAPGSTADASAKIKPKLSRQLSDKGAASFWVRFAQPDLSRAAAIKDRDQRGQAVYDTLTKAALDSQEATRALLDEEGVSYQSFWATNAIRVDAGDSDLVDRIAAQPAVRGVYATFDYRLEKPIPGRKQLAPNSVEWGVSDIHADDVWSQYGVKGEGIVVGSIDSGVQYDHPALVGHYRGNNGDGTFEHNYNWFDADGSCDGAPCDNDGHGTHTMGTMIGDDGGSNQIGVAPGATWISANGCCPSDAALIASGQWMLAPTDLAGESPDVSKRPDIINNSWGTTQPTNDPFMEDIELAWAASGIFGSWSNGNSGPDCQTSGSPGSRTINYSVGAYDVNDQIADFSARGDGQDGTIKPNISAPGVDVRSSFPDDTYETISGTSMASPHLAGTVALLWSAAPALVGDIEGTRALLDSTAIDSDDTSCGGTAEDNNVFGEGRLDALALLNAAPIGDTGTLAGTVTDAATGAPLAGAQVSLTGPANRTLTTGADGSYSVRLVVGDYSATVSAFGYVAATSTFTVATDETTDGDVALDAAPTVTLSGTVTDGSAHGWPLYARIDIDGPAPDVWTDPLTGEYSVTLPSDATYTLTPHVDYPGYEQISQDVTLSGGDATQDLAVPVDDSTCTAPGYRFNAAGETEDFNGDGLPSGWSVEDNAGNGEVWAFDDPGERGNLTGGDGGFAVVDSDFYGPDGVQDTSLVSPVIDMSSMPAPVITFRQDYNNLGDTADVDLSIDGGTTWETVLNQTTDVRGPREDSIQLPSAAGQSAVQLRFHYYDAAYAWWWEVDDVFIGNRTCDAIPGGLVLGNIIDARRNQGIVGATVTSVDEPTDSARTVATPDDDALADGYYWMFSSLTGQHRFTASARNYQSRTKQVTVRADDTVRANFRLGSGHLTVSPTSVSSTMTLGTRTKTRTFTVTNDGTAPVQAEFTERKGGFVLLGADGRRTTRAAIKRMDGAPLQRLEVRASYAAHPDKATTASPGAQAVGPHDAPWTDIADYPTEVMDNGVVYLDGVVYSVGGGDGNASSASVYAYDPATLTWTEKASLPEARNAMAVGEVDGQLVATGGWGESDTTTSTWLYDAAADSWTPAADAPVALSASGHAVAGGEFYTVGGCTTGDCVPMSNSVSSYDPSSDTWTTRADYPGNVAFASCGGIDGQIYCTGGTDENDGTAASYVYDPGADSWSPIADAPADSWAAGSAVANATLVVTGGIQGGDVTNRSFAFDPAAGTWSDLPNSNSVVYRGGAACGFYKIGGDTGGFTPTAASEVLPGFEDCATTAADVDWLSVSPSAATLAPGESVRVSVTMDSHVSQPGTYTAGVAIAEDTPTSVDPVAVTMTITPPKAWGKLVGTVSGKACTGTVAALPGATLQVDSWAGSWTFLTDGDGGYAYWFNAGANPLQLIAAKDGYAPQTRRVRLTKGQTVTADFTLNRSRC